MSESSLRIEKSGDVTCILLGPEFENLDEGLLDSIREELLETASSADPPQVVLDLRHTKFFGSSFIEVLFRIWNRLNALPSGGFAISGLTEYCREVLEVTHLDKLWGLYSTMDEAASSISKR